MEKFEPSHEGKVHYFRRPGSDNIQIRFSIMEKGRSVQKKRSTGETTYPRARKAADKIYTEMLVQAASGGSTGSRKFRSVAKAYLKQVAELVENGEKKPHFLKEETSRVERYLVGFFGDQAITNIRQSDIDKYVIWRTTYWISGPGKDIHTIEYQRGAKTITSPVKRNKPTLGTLHSDINCIRRVFAFARRERYIHERDSFQIEAPKGRLEKRAKFSYDEVAQLLAHLSERMLEPYQSPETTLRRYHLYLFAEIASGTGMRPGEVVSLCWNQIVGMHKGQELSLTELADVPPLEQDIRINVRDTKRGRIRPVRPIEGVGTRIMNLWDIADRPMGDEPLFDQNTKNPVASFNRSLGKELDRLGIRFDKMGRPRSANSFRHYYITRMVRTVRSATMVAQNVGTRIDNIERYYLNDDIEEFADELSKFE